ncbi:hypothetical protein SDJN03_09866, partial [Cucurbita argyrosperma subsp. sororia]
MLRSILLLAILFLGSLGNNIGACNLSLICRCCFPVINAFVTSSREATNSKTVIKMENEMIYVQHNIFTTPKWVGYALSCDTPEGPLISMEQFLEMKEDVGCYHSVDTKQLSNKKELMDDDMYRARIFSSSF